jgi:hypothetical protein
MQTEVVVRLMEFVVVSTKVADYYLPLPDLKTLPYQRGTITTTTTEVKMHCYRWPHCNQRLVGLFL